MISDCRFGIYNCGGIITDGMTMNDLRFTRRGSWFCFEGHLSTPLSRSDVERQGYFYEVRSKRTKNSIKNSLGVAEKDFEKAFKFNHRSSNYYDACIP